KQDNAVLDSIESGSSEVMTKVQSESSEHGQTVGGISDQSNVQEQCVNLEESGINDLTKKAKAELLKQELHELNMSLEPDVSSDQLSKEQNTELFEKAWDELTVLPQDMQLEYKEECSLESNTLITRPSVIVSKDEYLQLAAKPKYSSVILEGSDNVVNRQLSGQVSDVDLEGEKSSTGIQLREVNTRQYEQGRNLVSEIPEMASSDFMIKTKNSKKNTRQLNNNVGNVVNSQINGRVQNVNLTSRDSTKEGVQLSGNSRENSQLGNGHAGVAANRLSDKVQNTGLASRESEESVQLSKFDKQSTTQKESATNVTSQAKRSARLMELSGVDQIVIRNGESVPLGYEVLNRDIRVFQDMHFDYCVNMLQKVFDLEGDKVVVNSDMDLLLQNVFHLNKNTCIFLIKNSILVQFFSMFGIEFLSICAGSRLKEGIVDRILADILMVIKNDVDVHCNIYKILSRFIVLRNMSYKFELAWFHDNMRILYSAVDSLKHKSTDEEVMNFISVSAMMSYGLLHFGKNMILRRKEQLSIHFMEACKLDCECDLGVQACNVLFAFGPLYCFEIYGIASVRGLYVPRSMMMLCCQQNDCAILASVEKGDINFSVFVQEMVKNFYPLIRRNTVSRYIRNIMQCYQSMIRPEICNAR
ncbi:DUF3514 domain-containing protein, partial [Ehrlichia minasensis]